MPRFVASFGAATFTGCPSQRYWPSSAGWMPEMTLTSVDFPAPLSPTRPTTSPGMTRKSTPFSARTAPNRLVIPRTSSRGVVSAISGSPPQFGLGDTRILAARRVAAGADLRGLPEAVLDDRVLDVVLRHG